MIAVQEPAAASDTSSALAAIKDCILDVVGDDCEKIILFGSYAYGTPNKESDFDIFVVLKDGSKMPILVLQNIYCNLAKNSKYTRVDVLANYKTNFEFRSANPTIERKIATAGIVLYERP